MMGAACPGKKFDDIFSHFDTIRERIDGHCRPTASTAFIAIADKPRDALVANAMPWLSH